MTVWFDVKHLVASVKPKNFKKMKTSEVFKTVRERGREARVLGVYNPNRLPKIGLPEGITIDLKMFAQHIKGLPKDQCLVLGRTGYGADFVLGYARHFSRIHVAILRIADNTYQVLDCSLAGTSIVP